jgi:hypothetical protein
VSLVDSLLPDNELKPEEYTAMHKNDAVVELSGRDQFADKLTDLLRNGQAPESTGQKRQDGDLSFGPGAALYSQNVFFGSGAAVVVFERDLDGRNGQRSGSSRGPRRERSIRQYGRQAETAMGREIPALVRDATGQGSVVLYWGGWGL